MRAPLLVFAWGNPSRGDDAVGPALAARLEAEARELLRRGVLEVMTDFQLQPEHALDLAGRRAVLFVDALAGSGAPWTLSRLVAGRDASFTTHALSPAALLSVCDEVLGLPAPPAWLLGVRGTRFDLGAPPGEASLRGLERALWVALDWVLAWAGNDEAPPAAAAGGAR